MQILRDFFANKVSEHTPVGLRTPFVHPSYTLRNTSVIPPCYHLPTRTIGFPYHSHRIPIG